MQLIAWCDLYSDFSARLVDFVKRPIVWKILFKSLHMDNTHPFLRPAVLVQNCAYFSRDFAVYNECIYQNVQNFSAGIQTLWSK